MTICIYVYIIYYIYHIYIIYIYIYYIYVISGKIDTNYYKPTKDFREHFVINAVIISP